MLDAEIMVNLKKLAIIILWSCIVAKPLVAIQPINPNYKEILFSIPKEDYEALEMLFKNLMIENYLAYTLFGTKPITHKGAFFYHPTSMRYDSDQIFINNWKIWKKYAKLPQFKTPNYAFLEKKFPESFEIHFVNKRNVIACIELNIAIFRSIFGNDITPQEILNTILCSDDIYDAIGQSQILYGILFGFGKQNAIGYHQKFELGLPIPDPKPFHIERPTAFTPLPLPYFSVFQEDEETNNLKKKYKQERENILKIYSKGNFLDITLQKLTAK